MYNFDLPEETLVRIQKTIPKITLDSSHFAEDALRYTDDAMRQSLAEFLLRHKVETVVKEDYIERRIELIVMDKATFYAEVNKLARKMCDAVGRYRSMETLVKASQDD